MELSELIDSIDILEYISQYTEFTEKNGEYWGLSPLKEERTPSFSIRQETNSFYDFASGVGGNVLTFVRYYDKCGYQEAINKLKAYAGISGEFVQSKKLSATMVAKRFAPPKKERASNHSLVLAPDYMDRYEHDDSKLETWRKEGMSDASLKRFDVRYDRFSDRLVYPIRDLDGHIVNVGGRTLDPDWKEKGLRKYTYFKHWEGGMRLIYGLFENLEEIRAAHQIIIFEGAKSVILANTYGILNTGALLTSHLNPHQFKILIKLGFDVVFALDHDVPVWEDHNIQRLRQYVKVFYLFDTEKLLGEKDSPIDQGEEVFRHLLERKLRFL